MTGSYFGIVGAVAGAVVVPARIIHQLAMHRPIALGLAAAGSVLLAAAAIAVIDRRRHQPISSGQR